MSRDTIRLLLVVPLLVLTGCSKDNGPTGNGSHDTERPTVLTVDPPDGATGVRLLQPITITFSEAMDTTTLNPQTIALNPGIVPMRYCPSASGETLTLLPYSTLSANAALTLTLAGATDLAGNALEPDTLGFVTGPFDCAHLADRFEPNDESATATGVSLDTLYTLLSTCQGDVDIYRFTVEDTLKVTARTNFQRAADDAWLFSWLRADGRIYEATLAVSAHTGKPESFYYTFTPGTYYLQLLGYHAEELILYDLRLETSAPCRDDAFEENDFEDEAAPVQAGIHGGLTACLLDPDWYSVFALAGETVTFTVDTREYIGTRRLIIREPGGQQIAADTELDTPQSTIALTATADGWVHLMCMVWADGVDYDMLIAIE